MNPAMHLHVELPSSDSMLAPQATHEDEPADEKVFFAQVKHEITGE